jgi:hypothetical protein
MWGEEGSEFGSGEELVSEVAAIASAISHITLADVFREWEQRPQKCIDVEGDYID